MKIRKIDRIDILLVLLVGAAFLALANLPFGANQFGDFDIHIDAQTLAHALRGDVAWHNVGISRLPFTTLYYGLPYSILRSGSAESAYWKVGLIWNFLWTAVSLLLIRSAARDMAGERAGLVASCLVLLSPFVVYYALAISAEAPVWLMASVMLYGWTKWENNPTPGALGLATFGLAGMVLCRPNVALMLGCGFLCGLLMWRRQRARAIFALISSTAVLAISLVVGIVALRLPHPAAERSALDNFAFVAFHGSFQFRDEPFDWRYWDDEARKGSVDYEHSVETRRAIIGKAVATGQDLATLELRWVQRDFLEHPLVRLQMALIRVGAMHIGLTSSMEPSAFHLGPLKGRVGWGLFHLAANAATFVTILAACWFLAFRRRDLLSLWPLWTPWISVMVFHALTYSEARYIMPARPGLVLLAACGLVAFGQRTRQGSTREVQ